MERIKIENLPEDQKISKEEMRKVMGGAFSPQYYPFSPSQFSIGGRYVASYCLGGRYSLDPYC